MDGITYEIAQHYGKFQVCMRDPVFARPWYLKGIYKGRYDWTQDSLYGKDVSLQTARMHIKNLEAGADKGWTWYHNHWKEYWEELRQKREA